MATHDYVISNASGAAVRADLNNALAAIVSSNSNATEPSTTYSYMLWADTGSSPPVMKLRNAANDGWVTLFQLDGEWSTLAVEDGTAAAPSIYFKDSGTDTGFFSSGNNEVAIATGGTRQMSIKENGDILIGDFDNAAGSSTDSLAYFTPSLYVARNSGAAGFFNRNTNDGDIVELRQSNVTEGTISVAGNTVSYNQFLGSHWAALTDWSRPEIKVGTILETINELTEWKYAVIEVKDEQKKICYNGTAEIGSTITIEYEGEEYEGIIELETDPELNKTVKVKVNDTAASKAVYGVFVGWNTDSGDDGGIWNDMYVGAVGNYVIRMAAGQEPEIGDLVEADGTGCAVVQDDDIIRTKTVAKITSTMPQVTYDDGSFLVTCVLYCG